jgi:hypothetical protein
MASASSRIDTVFFLDVYDFINDSCPQEEDSNTIRKKLNIKIDFK